MKKIIFILLSLTLTLNSAIADCRPAIEKAMVQTLKRNKKVNLAGKISTGATFVSVGGFFGTMGVILTGPLWAGAIIGGTFGGIAALPIGTTFLITNAVYKKKIKDLGNTLALLNKGEAFEDMYDDLIDDVPNLTKEQLFLDLQKLNQSKKLCDGSIVDYARALPRKRLVAVPKEIKKWLRASYQSSMQK